MRERTVTHARPAAKVETADSAFAALADPTRRAMLDLLRRGALPAGHVAVAFPVSRPAISKHLRVLRRASLVSERREGRRRVYQLNPGPLRAVDEWLSHYRAFWETSLMSLKSFVEAEHAKEITGAAKSKAVRRTNRRRKR
jgi:DNA-binding transcriptional ArsR family regulator